MKESFICVSLSAFMLFAGGNQCYGSCDGLSAKEVGTELGSTVLKLAQAFARAELWSAPDCSSPRTKRLRELCSLQAELYKTVIRVDESLDYKCFDPQGDYAQSADYYVFGMLKSGLASTKVRERWHVLMRMFILCDDGTMLTDAGRKGCRQEVEEGALGILQTDREPFNRHLALEILGFGFVSERSRTPLLEIAKNGLSREAICPHGLQLEEETADQRGLTWERLAKGFADSRFACEQQLAKEALDTLDRHKETP